MFVNKNPKWFDQLLSPLSSSLHPLSEITRYKVKTLLSWHMIWHAWIRLFVILFPVAGMFVYSNTKLFKVVERGSRGNWLGNSVTLLLCIFNITLCILMEYRVSECALQRSSAALIFDISYGVHCVTIKDGSNLEMPPSIYTWRVSMKESRLKWGRGDNVH